MNNTLDKFAQFRKEILSKQNQLLHKHAQKLIAALYKDQEVTPIPLILIKGLVSRGYPHPPPRNPIERCRRRVWITPWGRSESQNLECCKSTKPQENAGIPITRTSNDGHTRKASKGRFAPLTREPMKPAHLDRFLRVRQRLIIQFFCRKT